MKKNFEKILKIDGTLHDIRIKCYGPDDLIFDKYPDIRNKVLVNFFLVIFK
jgi:hypothetical protein